MKKLIIFLILVSFNANAANFTDTIGTECGRILFNMRDKSMPSNLDAMKKRNSQFWALKKCLDLYKEAGGDINTLNKRFDYAMSQHKGVYFKCYLDYKYDTDKAEECVEKEYAKLVENLEKDQAKEKWYKKLFK